ncbi:MAG: hypothetical protein CFE21_07230 [Bacteroidetes bacterium B1(2017)]|nr:MAG: hypothetical protein CFE21_07230 [Bacteroidetes bacterium B1(2017)]
MSKAQDAMILRGKADTLKIKVIEIGTEEVKYKLWPVDEGMPVMVERKDRINKIIMSNGTVMRFSESEFANASNYTNQRKMAIKMDLFSLLSGTTSIAYEQNIEPGRSWEVGVGMIGLGFNTNETTSPNSGAFFRAGYKFINQPDYYLKGMRYTHIMKGAYIRPEVVAHFYSNKGSTTTYDIPVYNSTTGVYTANQTITKSTTSYSGYAFMLNFGKQWVFSDVFLVDFFVGAGIGSGNSRTTQNSVSTTTVTSSTSYGFYDDYSNSIDLGTGAGMLVNHEGNVGFATQMGLKLGILIGGLTEEK